MANQYNTPEQLAAQLAAVVAAAQALITVITAEGDTAVTLLALKVAINNAVAPDAYVIA